MTEPISQEQINRSFADQVRNLTAERTRLQQVINQRSVNVAVEMVEGLTQLVAQAEAGEPNSRAVIDALEQLLERARALKSRILIANGTR